MGCLFVGDRNFYAFEKRECKINTKKVKHTHTNAREQENETFCDVQFELFVPVVCSALLTFVL